MRGNWKVSDSDCAGLISDPDIYEARINQIEIPHGRTKEINEALTEAKEAISRPELGKLIRIARIARQAAIYDASFAAQTFTEWKMVDLRSRERRVSKIEEGESEQKEIRRDSEHMLGFHDFWKKNQSSVNKVNILKKI